MAPKSASAARGFTLVELLVVIAIIGVLVALLLPAVQAARDAARRAACASNLRQVSLAIHTYHDTYNCFPPGGFSPGPCCSVESQASWTIAILPFIEQGPLHNKYDHDENNEAAENQLVREQFIPVYVCPAEPNTRMLEIPESGPANDLRIKYMPGSYRGVGGRSDGSGWWDTYPLYQTLPMQWRGVFHVNDGRLQQETFMTLTDGSSNTLMVGEYGTRTRHRRRTFWAYTYGSYNKSDLVPESRTLLNDWDKCASIGGQGGIHACSRGWGSFHNGGVVQFALCDGSVRPVSRHVESFLMAESATVGGSDKGLMP